MKPNKNKLARVRLNKNKIKNINTVRQNQNIVIHLGKSNRKSHNLRTTNAPIIRRYYAPIPQPSQESFQTNKTLESVGNTLRELKAEQTILRNELNREQQTAKKLNPLSREREDNEINRGIAPMQLFADSPTALISEKSRALILQLNPNRIKFPKYDIDAEKLIEALMKKKPK
jgi:hypothetical protein